MTEKPAPRASQAPPAPGIPPPDPEPHPARADASEGRTALRVRDRPATIGDLDRALLAATEHLIDVIRDQRQPLPPEWEPLTPEAKDRLVAVRTLTPRERQVLALISSDTGPLATADLAAVMGVRKSTARTHVQNALMKLNVQSQRQAVVLLLQLGLISVHTGQWHPAVTGEAEVS